MKSILIISYSQLHRDPRILRQIHALGAEYGIQAVGLTNPNVNNVKFFEVGLVTCRTTAAKIRRALALLFRQFNKDLENRLSLNQLFSYEYKIPDFIFANDWDGLYAAIRLKKERNWGSKIYFDAHEYSLQEDNSFSWRIFVRPLVQYTLSRAKGQFHIMSTVCPTLARMYEEYFCFAPGTVRLIMNTPDYEPKLEPQPVGERIRLIHHGASIPERQLEKMIDMMSFLPSDKYELTFMLVKSDEKYYNQLVKRAVCYPNIHFADPVPFAEIPKFTNQFDIGVIIVNNNITSYKYSLPNKFFEFVQARIAIAVGDSPEMRTYIEKYQLGVSAKKNTAKAMAEEIMKLSRDDIMRFKQSAHEHARELSSEPNIELLREIAEELAGK